MHKLPLDTLVFRLENAGFEICLQTRIKIHDVLQKLGRDYLANPEELGFLLCPLIAKNPLEQERFNCIYEDCYRTPGKKEDSRNSFEVEKIQTESTPFIKRWVFTIGIGFIIFIIIGWFIRDNLSPKQGINVYFEINNKNYVEGEYGVGDTIELINKTRTFPDTTQLSDWNYSWQIGNTPPRKELIPVFKLLDAGTLRIILQYWEKRNPANKLIYKDSINVIKCRHSDFNYYPTKPVVNESMIFSALDIPRDRDILFVWNFGDRTKPDSLYNQNETSHRYSEPGNYEVILIITRNEINSDCRIDTVKKSIEVRSPVDTPDTDITTQILIIFFGMFGYVIFEIGRYLRYHSNDGEFEEKYNFDNKSFFNIKFPEPKTGYLFDAESSTIAGALRRRESGNRLVLNLTKTIRNTIRNAGFIELNYKTTSKPTEYLILIDEVNPDNNQFKLFEHFVKTLKNEDVLIDTFNYRMNPNIVWNDITPEGMTITQLYQRYPKHMLIIFGDGQYLVDPIESNIPNDICELYKLWDQRVLITPLPSPEWSYKEQLLSKIFILLPFDIHGQLTLKEILNKNVNVHPEAQQIQLQFFKNLRHEKKNMDTDKYDLNSCNDLRKYLPNDLFIWIAATAIYPSPKWEILLEIGKALTPIIYKRSNDTLCTYANLQKLMNIPWLRSGEFPFYLRDELLISLKSLDSNLEIEKTARKAVIDLLASTKKTMTKLNINSRSLCDINKEIVLQRVARSQDDKAAQNELFYLLSKGKIDISAHSILNKANNRKLNKYRKSRVIIRFATCLLICFLVSMYLYPILTKKTDLEPKPTSKVRVIKLAHALDTNHPVHMGMVFMADKVSEKSGGKMRVDIYPGGQLGAERELIELLQIGSLAITKVSASPLEGFVPEMKIFSIPYVFRSEQHLWKVLNGDIGKRLLLAGEDYYLRGLCYYDAGSRSMYTKSVPIKTPSDLKGLKIRVQYSPTAVKTIQALGGSATPISWGELYTALQQGVVDGAENNAPSFYLSRQYEVCKYYSFDEHTAVPDVLLISSHVWNQLTAQEQKWLQEAADESVIEQRRLWKEATEQALIEIQKAGVEVIYPDKGPFREAVKEMHESYKGTILYDLIQEIESY